MNNGSTWQLEIRINGNPVHRKAITGTVLDAKTQAGNMAWWMNGTIGERVVTVAILKDSGEEIAVLGYREGDQGPTVHAIPRTAIQTAEELASRLLGMSTLDTRNSDSLDFKEVAVWNVKTALLEAFHAGVQLGRTKQ